MVLVVKNLPASAGDTRDMGLIPGSGRSPGGGNGTHSRKFSTGKFHGQKTLMGYKLCGCKKRVGQN